MTCQCDFCNAYIARGRTDQRLLTQESHYVQLAAAVDAELQAKLRQHLPPTAV